jgi:hypothetical protein
MDMSPSGILQIIAVLEKLAPLIEKVVADLPQIKADIDALKAKADAQPGVDNEMQNRLQGLVDKLNTLGG